MTHNKGPSGALTTALSALMLAAGCASSPGAVPEAYLQGNPLDRNPIRVAETSQVLELPVAPEETRLTLESRRRLEDFLIRYKRVGSGSLLMSLPSGGVNAQSSVRALAEVRQIAYDLGVNYADITGSHYDARGDADAPIVLAFHSYDAVAPDCPSLATIDLANAESNNEIPTFGCSIRANMAAMIAEPQDLYGDRPLGSGDVDRRFAQLEKFRSGEITGAARSDDESGTVSSIGN